MHSRQRFVTVEARGTLNPPSPYHISHEWNSGIRMASKQPLGFRLLFGSVWILVRGRRQTFAEQDMSHNRFRSRVFERITAVFLPLCYAVLAKHPPPVSTWISLTWNWWNPPCPAVCPSLGVPWRLIRGQETSFPTSLPAPVHLAVTAPCRVALAYSSQRGYHRLEGCLGGRGPHRRRIGQAH